MTRVRGRALRIAAAMTVMTAAAAVWVTAAHAATFTVTRFDDPAPGTCDPADCSLREAVVAANALAGADTIALPAGTYTLTIADGGEGGAATDAARGDLDVTDALTLQPSGGPATIDAGARFSAGAASLSVSQPGTAARVFHVVSTSLTMTSVGVTGGSADQGAGVQVETGSLTVTGGSISGNVANGTCCGGGIGALRSDVTLNAVTVADNAVAQCCGGGIYNESSTVTLNGGWVQTNDAYGCCGAGIHNWSDANAGRNAVLAMSGTEVSDNDVRSCCGGGMYNEDGGPVTVQITGGRFTNNVASDDCCGGALYSKRSATVTATGTVFRGNTTAGCCGGAVYNEGSFSLERGAFVGNSILNCCGGALAGIGTLSSTALTNVTVSGNSAGTEPGQAALPSAGGLYLDAAGGQMTLNHVTVANNGGSNGASGISNGDVGVPAQGTLTMRHSIVSGNTGAPQCRGPITSQGHNIASDGSCTLTQATDRPSTNPQLAPLSGEVHLLGSGSPAVDAIPLAQCPPPATDQRGVTRPQDRSDAPNSGCDIGAVEMEGNVSPTPTPTPGATATPTPTPGATPTPTPGTTPTPTPTPGTTPTPTPSPGATPTPTPTTPPSPGVTPTPTATASASPSPTPTPGPIDPRCDDPGVVCGTDGSETIRGTDDGELIICGDGDDVVEALGGDDTIECGDAGDTGDKTVRAGAGDDEVTCDGTGDDEVAGGAGNDSVTCGAGDDVIEGGGGNDRLSSRGGNDFLDGGAGRDHVSGGSGRDALRGGGGRDRLRGGGGRDTLSGGPGNDVLSGGRGRRDACNGGPGRNRFRGCEVVTARG